jgi:hypothetical protein
LTIEESDEPTFAPTEEVVAKSAEEEPEEAESETDEPTPAPSIEETKKPTDEPETDEPTPSPTAEEEEEDEEEEPEEVEEETDEPTPAPTAEDVPDESSALVIELKPCEDPLAMTVNQAYWRSWSSE